MAESGNEYELKVRALIKVINLKKDQLIAKYGIQVTRFWDKK